MALTDIIKLITLDIYNHDTTPETIKAIAADNDTRCVAAEIQNEGVWYDIGSDSDVELIVIRPDKVGVSITGEPYPIEYETGGEIDPETGDETPVVTSTYYGVYAELDQPAIAQSGILLGQFKITNGNQILHTEIFKINNGRALDAEASDWAGEYEGHNLDEMAAAIDENTDDIAAIESDVSTINGFTDGNLFSGVAWEKGGISESGGNSSSTSRYRTTGYIDLTSYSKITISEDGSYKFAVYCYDADKTFIPDLSFYGFRTTALTLNVSNRPDIKYLRIQMQRTDNTIQDGDYEHMIGAYTSYLCKKINEDSDRITEVEKLNALFERPFIDIDAQYVKSIPVASVSGRFVSIYTVTEDLTAGRLYWNIDELTAHLHPTDFTSLKIRAIQYDANNTVLSRTVYPATLTISASCVKLDLGLYFYKSATEESGSNYDETFTVKMQCTYNADTFNISLSDEVYIPALSETDIVGANSDAINKVWASRWLRSATANPLTLLWFSDIHRWKLPLERIIKFRDHLASIGVLNDTIVTGDLVRNSSDEASAFTTFWNNTEGTENILIALGNHDHYDVGTQPHGKATFEKLDTMFFSEIANWNVTRESNYPFYYKDYADQKIRLIVADPAITNSEADETTWLNETLSGAKTLGYAVIVASHFVYTANSEVASTATIYDNNWSNNVARDAGTSEMTYDWYGCDIIKCVTDFIADGGKFACYMIGHTHTDIVSCVTGHPDQLIINVACASDDRDHETPLTKNDLPRFDNSRTQDCFNVLTVDAENSIIKCVRVGANVTMYQQPRTAFAYNYLTHEFINLM